MSKLTQLSADPAVQKALADLDKLRSGAYYQRYEVDQLLRRLKQEITAEIAKKLLFAPERQPRWHLSTSPGWCGAFGSPLTSTSWDGDSYSTTSKTLLNLNAVFGTPAGIRAVLVRALVRDSASATTDAYLILSPDDTSGSGISWRCYGRANDAWEDHTAVVPCTSDGNVYYQINASGTNTFDVHIQIHGYLL